MADKRPTKTKLPETKIDLELPTSKGELVPYKKPEGGLSDTPQGKRATRNIVKVEDQLNVEHYQHCWKFYLVQQLIQNLCRVQR